MDWRDVPAILRRCVVAVYSKSTGGSPDGVVRAFKICRDKLADQGYLYHRGQNNILESITLTGKGYLRNLHHDQASIAGQAKDLTFSRLFKMLEPKLYEYDGAGGKQPPRSSADGSASADEQQKRIDNPGSLGEVGESGVLYPPDDLGKKTTK